MRDLLFYFNINNKNTIENKAPDNGEGVTLVETLAQTMARLDEGFKKLEKQVTCIHEFTITFKDKVLLNTNSLILHEEIKKYIKEYLDKDHIVRRKLKVIMKVEKPKEYIFIGIPEYSKTGRLHYHCAMWANGYEYHIQELKRKLSLKYGRCTGKEIYKISNFKKYVYKDLGKTKLKTPFVLIKESGKK